MIRVWTGFIAFVLLMLALDLGVFHRKAHVIGVKEALRWSAFWIAARPVPDYADAHAGRGPADTLAESRIPR